MTRASAHKKSCGLFFFTSVRRMTMVLLLVYLLLTSILFVSGFINSNPRGISQRESCLTTRRRSSSFVLKQQLSENNDTQDRSESLRKALETVGELQDDNISVGSTVVAGKNIPNLGIWQFQSYEITSIYDQQVDDDTGVVTRIPRQSLNEISNDGTRYVTLYSSKHHKDGLPVVVSPTEVELSSMRDEVVDSVLMALPLFGFWTALAFSFASQYSERTGGSFVDAFFGR